MPKSGSSWNETTVLILKMLGLYSPRRTKINVVLFLFYLILVIFILYVVALQFTNINGDIFLLVTNLLSFGGFAQVLGKMIVLFKNQDQFTRLLQKMEQFWKTDLCRGPIKTKLDTMANTVTQIQKVFIIFVILSIIAMILYSFLENQLPLGIWTFREYKVLFKCTQMAQVIVLLCLALGVSVFDCIFSNTCVQTIIQFKILYNCLSDLNLSKIISNNDDKDYYDKLKLYIQQHNFLLGFLTDLQNYYSLAFLTECVTVAPVICAEIFVLLNTNNPNIIIQFLILFFADIFQLSFYCISADFVSNEAFTVGDAIYNSDWYSSYSPSLAKQMIMLIQKSQQPVIFTAGGLFEMKARTVLTVLRISWSACTIMNNLKSKN